MPCMPEPRRWASTACSPIGTTPPPPDGSIPSSNGRSRSEHVAAWSAASKMRISAASNRCATSIGREMPEVMGAAAVTALVHHYVQPAGGQHWKLFQGLVDEGQVRVDPRHR